MKNYLIGFVLGGLTVLALANIPKQEKEYTLTTLVIETDTESDIVSCEDFNGNVWEFEGVEDWLEGDICELTLNDKGTATIYDDEITRTIYKGFEW